MNIGKIEEAKKVETKDLQGDINGFLIELYKDDGKTVAYLTCTASGSFKGYHLHRVRAARYVCIKGKIKITLWKPGTQDKEEHILDADKPQRLFIPKDIATGLLNIGTEDCWLINYPDPPYDPSLIDEQVEYTEDDLKKGIVK